MCSVSGILAVEDLIAESNGLKTAVLRMNAVLHHRGPDDQGVFEESVKNEAGCEYRVCLGNTRLAIIDKSAAGHQPMIDSESGISISYNGEAYNFRELRSEIGNEFGPWHSATDTEVVLRVYQKWGIDGFQRLRGMFAVAIWDGRKRQLVLARDPFGIKPLYYSHVARSGNAQRLVFSSEIRALLASGFVSRRLSRQGVASYLSFGSIQTPLTIIEGVNALMPGECLIVKCDGRNLHSESISIASDFKCRTTKPPTRAEAARILREELRDSLRAHMVADVPLGVFLSGGLDSSALVALTSTFTDERVKTFSVVFEGSKLSEAHYSRLVAKRFRTDHHEISLDEEQLLGILGDALQHFDQPSMDGLNTFIVSKGLKQAGVTVALSGLGGDELFAGYPSFRLALKLHTAPSVAKTLMRMAGKLSGIANGSVGRNKFWQLINSDYTPEQVYRITRQLFNPQNIFELTGTPANTQSVVDLSADPINEMSLLELRGYMANTLLRDTDNMSMSHSLEVRVPFVDVKVAEFALSLPGHLKLNGDPAHVSKPLLAAALEGLLPNEVLHRHKMGFTLPFESWIQSRLRPTISKVFSDSVLLRGIGLSSDTVACVWSRFLKAPGSIGWSRPWSLYVLAKWCENNNVTN